MEAPRLDERRGRLLRRLDLSEAGVLEEEGQVHDVPEVSVSADARVAVRPVEVELDGLGDDVGVDGEEEDEGGARVGEEHVDGVEHGEHLGLLAAVQPVHDDDEPRLLPGQGIQPAHHLQEQMDFAFHRLQLRTFRLTDICDSEKNCCTHTQCVLHTYRHKPVGTPPT